MKKINFLKAIFIFNLLWISIFNATSAHAQTVSVSQNCANTMATYTFTYVTSQAIGQGTSTSNVFYHVKDSNFPLFQVNDIPNLGSVATFKVNGVNFPINATNFNLGGSWQYGIQLSTNTIVIPAGSLIEFVVSGVITNPSTNGVTTLNWRTADGGGNTTEFFSGNVNYNNPTPTVSNQSFCSATTVANLIPNGATYNWYATSTSTSPLSTSTSLSTNTYYVTNTSAGCESTRVPVVVTINSITTNTQNVTACGEYTSPSGTKYSLSGTYVETSTDGCNQVTYNLTINPVVKIDRYLGFDGSNDRVEIGTAINTTFSSNFSVEAWINTSTLNTSINAIISNQSAGGSNPGFSLFANSFGSSNRRLLFEGSNQNIQTANGALPASGWVHVAAVKNGATVTLYINGVASASGSFVYSTTSNSLKIGTFGDNNFPFKGGIDNVRIWNKALTITEVNTSKNNSIFGNHPNLLANYEFNQGIPAGTNTTVTSLNSSTTIYNGTLFNFALTGNSSNWLRKTAPAVVAACYSYTWNGTVYTTSGIKTFTGVDSVTGCSKEEEINLTINQSTSSSQEVSVCGSSYTWLVNQNTYTQSGIYYSSSTNAAGCSHLSTLELTLNPITTLGSITTVVNSSYTWPLPYGTGLTYTTSQIGLTNVNGCNTATLNLTVSPIVNTFTIGPSCGSTISNLAVTIRAPYVVGASSYIFRVTNLNTNAVFVVNRPVNSFALTNYPGITLATPYQVEVSTNGGVNYGTPCTLYTPTPLATIGAQCGTTLTSFGQWVYATYQPSVIAYRFRITNSVTNSVQVYDALNGLNRFSFNQLPASFRLDGTVYSVEVSLRNSDGTYLPYGTPCNITTPGTAIQNKVIAVTNDFEAVAYPNPFEASFMFDIKAVTQSEIEIRIYDMLGQQIEIRNVKASNTNDIQFGDSYPSGVYNVVISQGENTKTIRMIKR